MPGIDDILDLAEAGLTALDEAGDATAPAPPGHAPPVLARRFRVVDAIDSETGQALHIVTDGRDRAECNSRAFAERVQGALHAS